MNSIEQLKANIETVRYNPSAIQRLITNAVVEATQGKIDVVDASNPFVFSLEASAILSSSAMSENALLNRKQYRLSAQKIEDLYPHLSDYDFYDLFAQPSNTGFVFVFEREELLQRMVQVPGSDMRKIVIPRNTNVNISGNIFSLSYPIEIRQMAHGGLQVVWDLEKKTPLSTPATNIINWQTYRDGSNKEMIAFGVSLDQFSIITATETINAAQKFSLTQTITEQFYYCRVWHEIADNTWEEIRAIYTEDIYSNTEPTAIVKVVDKTVTVEIPIVYTRTRGFAGKIRVDVYQTQGPVSLDLSGYDQGQFKINWLAIDKLEQNEFVAPLKAMQKVMAYATGKTVGGANMMTYEEIYERAIRNTVGNNPEMPITPAQIQRSLMRKGYNIVNAIDNLTSRAFMATRDMPEPIDSELITAAAAGMGTLHTTGKELAALSTTVDNGDSITIKPDTLYRITNGILSLVSLPDRNALMALPGDKFAIELTQGNYFYSPFHYVLDMSQASLSSRAYYLDDPAIASRSFIAENDTTLLQCSVADTKIERTANGWRVLVQTNSSEEFIGQDDTDVNAVLGWQPDRTGDYAFIKGELIAKSAKGERVYSFAIDTNYNVDSDEKVRVTSGLMYNNEPINLPCDLLQDFDVFFTVAMPPPTGWIPATFDPLLPGYMLPSGTMGVTRERLSVRLGWTLDNLWRRARTVVGASNYAVWDMDVPATYDEDQYTVDPETGLNFTIVNGQLVYNKTASAGDVQKNADGSIIYRYRKGDIKRDAYGNPYISTDRTTARQFDLMLIEAAYYFANNDAATEYRKSFITSVVQWITEDLQSIESSLLDKTDIYFTPTQVVGQLDVVFGAGLKLTIDAGQSFTVKIYLKDSVYKNDQIKEKLRKKTITTIGECLKAKTVAVSGIIDALRAAYGADAISMEVSTLGGVAQLAVLTVIDDTARLSIRKKLSYRDDGSFALAEDVDVQFIPHERSGVTFN